MSTRICHLSSAHVGLDTRIFHKECVSLANAGYDVHLVIAASPAQVDDAARHGVRLHVLPAAPQSRLLRVLGRWRAIWNLTRSIRAKVYHFHDLELLPLSMILRLFGAQIIYDVHEDVPKDILTKDWIPFQLRRLAATCAGFLEWIGAKWMVEIIAATSFIRDKFLRINPNAVDVNNFPKLQELANASGWEKKRPQVCYIGGIGKIRGIEEIVAAIGFTQTDVSLELCGKFGEPDVKSRVKGMPGWARVQERGFVDRAGVREVLSRSVAGLVTLHPTINYIDALPVKMFEYMSAGIPVIASDFPLWRQIIEGSDCGLLVDPLDPHAIAKAIDTLVANPEMAERMGRNGQKAVEERYNWDIEAQKLLAFYDRILARV